MSWMSRTKHLLQRAVRRQRVEEELDAEVQAYFEILIERGMARGLSREEAQRAARLQFGGAEQVKARVRDARSGSALETTLQDLGYAFRRIRKNPGFIAVAILSLAIGSR